MTASPIAPALRKARQSDSRPVTAVPVAPAPQDTRLPDGFVVALDSRTRIVDDGRALLGGHPTRLLRLTPRARALLVGRTVPVRDAASALLADRLLAAGLAHPLVRELPADPEATHTFVIPVHDRAPQLDRLLASIGPGHPVIVVDDASQHPDQIRAVAERHRADLVVLPTNRGQSAARNTGARLAQTPYVVFVDSDVVLPPQTIPTVLKHFADPRVAMVVPRISALSDPAVSGSWLGRYEAARSSLDLGERPALVRPGAPVSWVATACAVARADALGAGFDERMRVGEDVDLCWRLVAAGWRVRHEPAVQAEHEHRVRFKPWFARKAFYGTGVRQLAPRHPECVAPAVMAPWATALVLVLAAQRRWSVPAAGAISAATTARIARKLDGTGDRWPLAAALAAEGSVNALGQAAALLTRHWWPLSALGCALSPRTRRAVAAAALLDVALEYRPRRVRLDPLRFALARRLDDVAYGSGVWISSLTQGTTTALRPRLWHRRAPRA